MWNQVSQQKYDELLTKYSELKKEMMEPKNIEENLNVPLVIGKYFIAEKNNAKNFVSWKIYRIDGIIKNTHSNYVFEVESEQNAQGLIAELDKHFDGLLELKPKSTSTELLLWLANAHKMAKSVYLRGTNINGYEIYEQLVDGAIPMWWINQELERVATQGNKSKDQK